MRWLGTEDFLLRARQKLDPPDGIRRLREMGDHDWIRPEDRDKIRPAAVLIGIISRPEHTSVLLTQRPRSMSTHAGQVAFPGGKVEPSDASTNNAALREASEEVGVVPSSVGLIARLGDYVTGTNFRITPVLGTLPSDFVPKPDVNEVASVFEVPLEFLMNPRNHHAKKAMYMGKQRQYFEMPYKQYRIWGVTAGIIRSLYETLYE